MRHQSAIKVLAMGVNSVNSGNKKAALSRGFTLAEVLAAMVILAILAYGGSTLPSDNLNTVAFRIEAERVADGIRWARDHAVNHAHSITIVLAGNQYSIFDQDNRNQPVDWPLIYGNCSNNVCKLDSRVSFKSNAIITVSSDGAFITQPLNIGQPEENLIADAEYKPSKYRIVIPLSTKLDEEKDDAAMYVVISKVSGIVKIVKRRDAINPL